MNAVHWRKPPTMVARRGGGPDDSRSGERWGYGIPIGHEAPWLVGGHGYLHDDHDHSPGVGHMGRSTSSRSFDRVVDRLSCLRGSLAVVRNPQARPEYLSAVPGLDCAGRCRDRGSRGLRIAASELPLARSCAPEGVGPGVQFTGCPRSTTAPRKYTNEILRVLVMS